MSRSLSRDTVDVLLFLRKQPSLFPVRPVAGKYVLSQIRHIDVLSVRRHHSLMDMGTFLSLRVRAPALVPQDTGRRFQSVILPDPVHGQAATGIKEKIQPFPMEEGTFYLEKNSGDRHPPRR